MKAYVEIFRTTFIQYFIYRVNFLLWRFRVVLGLLIVYFLWLSVFDNQTLIMGYSQQEMLTYILLSSLVSSFVLSTKTADVAGDIVQGYIINIILKPISFFKYHLVRDGADKLVNGILAVMEIALIIAFLKPPILIQDSFVSYFLFSIFLVLGVTIAFFVNMILSLLAFWTVEVWAPRFIFYIIIFFLSGAYFPLDILPKTFFNTLLLTPFPYFYYIPTKVYLDPTSPLIPFFLLMSGFWVTIMYFVTKLFWSSGMRSYAFYGR